ncbi:MAG: hypothetical protein LBK02_02230, partial [Treponema sp.]|nr:hypothetical protein [Treponema sp.]
MKKTFLFFVVFVFVLFSCEEEFQPLTIINSSSFDIEFNISSGGTDQETFSIPQNETITLNLNDYGPIVDSSITPKTVTYSVDGFNITFSDKDSMLKESMPMEIKNSTDEDISLVEKKGIMYPSPVPIGKGETNTDTRIYGKDPDFLVKGNENPVQ